MASTSLTEVLRETLALFGDAGEPRTTTEVANRLDLGRRSTYERLERLVEHGRLETKKVGGNGRVWWRPPSNAGAAPDWSAAAESLIDDVLDSAEVGVFVLDEDFDVAWINDATERYFGLDRERVIGRDKQRLIERQIAPVVDEGEAFTETVQGTYDDNTDTEQFECRVTPAEDREERWLEHRSKPIESGAYAGGRVELYYDITDRKQSERAHDQDRTQFESIVEAAEEYAIFMLDPDGTVRTWNKGAKRVKGYAAGEIIGENFAQFYTDEQREAGVPQQNLAAAAEHGSVEDEGWRLRADGSRFWADVTITAVRGDDGEVDGYVKLVHDMTERRQNRQEIQRERNLLEQVQEASPIGIAIFDTAGELRRANQRFLELLGRGDAESVDYSLGEQVPLDADGNVIPYPERPAPRALSTGEPVTDQRIRLDGPDGRTRWLSVNAKPFGGEADGVVVTTTDITQLKEQAQRLERQRDDLESELEEMFRRIDDAFFSLDGDLRFDYLNEQANALLGTSSSELIGEYIWDVLEPGPKAEAAFEEALETQQSVSFEEHYEPLETWFENHVYPSEDGLSVYFSDITEQKERESRLQRFERMVETVDDGVYATDGEGDFVFVNDAFVAMSDHTREELLGSHGSAFFGERFVDTDEREWQELVDGERDSVEFETDIACPDSESRIVHNRFVPLEVDDETGRVGVTRDITERKERERALEESKRRYRTLVENFPNGAVSLFDEDLECLITGGEAYEGLDVSVEDLEGDTIPEHLPAELGDTFLPRFRAVFEGQASEFEFEFNDQIRQFQIVPVRDESGSVFAGLMISQDVTQSREYVRELEHQREQLTALNNLNDIVRDITDAVINQSTREEIEGTVCERLADSESYLFAWIGDVDTASQTVNIREEAGVEGNLHGITLSVDPDDERCDGPTGRALRTGELQVTHDIRADSRHDPWREHIEQYGVRSSAAIPIVHEGTTYGVINVYADRPYAFDGQERAVISQLGEVVGHAIAAAERKQALMSDELVELEFQVRDVFTALDAHVETDETITVDQDGTITLDHAVPVDDEEFLVYGTATPDAIDTVTRIAEYLPYWQDLTIRSEGDPTRFEVRMTDPPVLSVAASFGGYVEQAVVEDGDYRMTVHLAPSVDVRRVTNAIETAYPTAEMLRHRQISRNRDDDPKRFQRHLVENLTDRQQTSLEAAYRAGFFEWPRDASGEEVAESIGVASPTFHQHLRKAERKVLDAVFSFPMQSVG